ncbi:2-amino-4-hydroxy-6- hydroxymethyldihydropteridine pyrophosphokinase [Legionella nautarum]|uniref:2-amino-4-hydroxy-6-hydroxymethyldihydropteridine pyrophosphokinase n=1 Tax=Legionella nautarum TaxID=45070 RepID=A0A0W0WWR8_9GAMM|nr:2-amino-4-hydroxy-6-hydroxymethyldihydropteridine diphosphokinase [Legionella nautarum]KTD36662.1 2-amino-4-hydroxy-6- hydroxymethyldihydropteridine pyrophosphokinase [Legionella nautarum]
MILCYLGLGSNLDSPERQLRTAIDALRKLPHSRLIEVASFYRNEAWGKKTQPKFTNTVASLRTRLTPQQLLKHCLEIEQKQKRVRKTRWGARTLDIDILLYGSMKINSTKLTIPHPRMHERDFVLKPLQELLKST